MNDETAIIQQPGQHLAGLNEQAEQFIKATKLVQYQEGLRTETKRRQQTDLLTFARFLASVGADPGDFYNDLTAWAGIGAGLIEAFIQWQKLQGYSIGTINVRLATVKQYCHIAHAAHIIDTDTHAHIVGVKAITNQIARNIDQGRQERGVATRVGYKKASPTLLTDEQVEQLRVPATGFLSKRDALLMCLLLEHGLRVGEIVGLKRNQLALRGRTLTFYRPKVNIWQTQALTKYSLEAARAYIATLPDKQETLFDITIRGVQERVHQLGRLLGIDELSPHDLRHSWATRAARHGTPLERLKQAGGWSNIQTPLRYIKESAIANEGVILE